MTRNASLDMDHALGVEGAEGEGEGEADVVDHVFEPASGAALNDDAADVARSKCANGFNRDSSRAVPNGNPTEIMQTMNIFSKGCGSPVLRPDKTCYVPGCGHGPLSERETFQD